GEEAALPTRPDRHTYYFVFTGCVAAGGERFGEAETGLVSGEADVTLRATEASLVVAFVVDRDAAVCREGSVGDGETVHRMAARARTA
ncbi:MAG: hypothetical protein ABW275_07400, partial [Hansschlegelia sp.]